MHPQALAQSATLALSAGTAAVSAAVGAIILAIAWFAHYRLAHRHPYLDLAAKVFMAAGATILFASPGATLLQSVNRWSARVLGSLARTARLSGSWPATVGVLTLVEVVLLLWAGIHLWDAIRARRSGRGGRSGTLASSGSVIGTSAGRSGGKSWQWVEHRFERYGALAVGPLTVTLPGPAGALAAVPFAALAAEVGHLVGSWFGLG